MIRSFKFRSIGNMLTFWIFITLTALVCVWSIYVVNRVVATYEDRINHELELQLSMGESALETALWDLNENSIDNILTRLILESTLIKAEIYEQNGMLLYSKTKTGLTVSPALQRSKEKVITYKGQALGYLKLTSSLYRDQLIMQQMVIREIIFALTTLLIVGGLVRILTHKITQSITSLSIVAHEIEHGNYEAKFHVSSEDEIGQLSCSLSAMQNQIIENMMALDQDRMEIAALYEETSAMNEELTHTLDLVNRNYEETLQTLANAIEANDHYTKGHCERVKTYALELGKKAGLDYRDLLILGRAAILHDIGKIGVPSHILNKSASLTDEEFTIIKSHSQIGSQILSDVYFMEASIPVIEQHHERFDGTGYPLGLNGDNINYLARILSIADAFDAMTTSRAYRKIPLSFENAIKQLLFGSGTQFDPDLVLLFKACIEDGGGIA